MSYELASPGPSRGGEKGKINFWERVIANIHHSSFITFQATASPGPSGGGEKGK
jgi:hypothetical protein